MSAFLTSSTFFHGTPTLRPYLSPPNSSPRRPRSPLRQPQFEFSRRQILNPSISMVSSCSFKPPSNSPVPNSNDPSHHVHHFQSATTNSGKSAARHTPENADDNDVDKVTIKKPFAHLPILQNITPKKALGLAAVALFLIFLRPTTQSAASLITQLTSYASKLGTMNATILLFITNFFTVLFCFPANMGLMIAAGAILPPLNAFSALFLSKLAAACIAFILSKTLLATRAKNALENSYPRLAQLLQKEGSTAGWRFVLLMRLSPFPGFILNYLLSLTGVSFPHYFFGSILGVAPPVLNLVLIGNAAREVGVGVTTNSVTKAAWLPLSLKVATVASMVAVTIYITRFISKAFDKDGLVANASTSGNTEKNNQVSLQSCKSYVGNEIIGSDDENASISDLECPSGESNLTDSHAMQHCSSQ